MPNRWCDGLAVRALTDTDLPAVVALERQEHSPWGQRQVRDESAGGDGIMLVATLQEHVVGWCCSRLCGTEAELLKLGVEQQCRRLGVGSRLLASLERALAGYGARIMFLEVRARNIAAVSFYRSSGYLAIGRRPGYYHDPDDDALIMSKDLRQKGVTT